MTKIDLVSEPMTPYHGKMSTENAKAWHNALVATASEVEKRYDELKAFGASSNFHLEDLSQCLTGEVDAIRQTRSNKLKFAAGITGLGLAAGGVSAYLGHPVIGGLVGVVAMFVSGNMVSDAAQLKKNADSTEVAAGLVNQWAQIDASATGAGSHPAVASTDPPTDPATP